MEKTRLMRILSPAIYRHGTRQRPWRPTGGNLNLARELLQMLVQGFPQECSKLYHCLRTNDWPLLAERVHRLRGATSYCGMPALHARLKTLMEVTHGGDRERIMTELAGAEEEMERLVRIVTPD